MIIKRKYATYGQLCSDEASKATIIDVFDKYSVSQDVRKYILDPYNDIIVLNTEMSSGIPGKAYQELRQKFEELDLTEPFDNQLTYRNVNGVMTFPSRKGTAEMQILYSRNNELPDVIVQVLAFEYKDGEMKFIEPWDIGTVILG